MSRKLWIAAIALAYLLLTSAAEAQIPMPRISYNLRLRPGEGPPQTLKELLTYLSPAQRTQVANLQRVYFANGDPRALARFLSHNDVEVRKYAIELLVFKGEASLDVLYEAASSDNARVRSMAMWTLRRIGPRDSEELFPLLNSLYHDRDPQVRLNTCALFTRTDARAIPPLIEMLEDRDDEVRTKAAEVLGYFRDESEEAVPFLVDRLTDPSAHVRRAAVSALGQIGPWAVKFADQQLMAALDDQDHSVRTRAAVILSASDDHLAKFVAGLADPSEARRQSSAAGLAAAGTRAVPVLLDSLKHEKPQVRYSAAYALGQIGKPAEAALPQLSSMAADDKDDLVRYYANAAVGMIRR